MFPALRARRRSLGGPEAVLLLLVLLAWGLRVVRLGDLALVRDEAYFYQWGQHLDWAYYDHPAGTGVLAWLSSSLAGGSEFGVRWLNMVVGTLCVVLTFWLGRWVLGGGTGLLGAAAVAFGAPYVITSRLLYTDALHLASLLLVLGTYWRLVCHRDDRLGDGLALGLSLALMVNTKYTAYLVAIALAGATLLDHRSVLKKSSTWWAVGLGLLGLVPVLAWNARHGWVSFEWQLSHLTLSSPGSSAGALVVGLGRNLAHAAVYFSWPLALAVCAGLVRYRTPADRLLSLVALLVLAPVAVSPANSPRNLTTGAVPLLLLAADRGMRTFAGVTSSGRRSLALLGVAACWIAVAIYGSGSVVAMVREAPQVPQSSVVREIRYDAAGWDTLAGQLPGDGTLVAVDYSLAGHLAYYTDRPVTTAWPQYRMWGTPDLEDVLVVASTYLAPGVVASQVEAAYTEYAALAPVVMGKVGGETKQLRLWSADGLRVPPEEFLDRMDFLTLYAEGQ